MLPPRRKGWRRPYSACAAGSFAWFIHGTHHDPRIHDERHQLEGPGEPAGQPIGGNRLDQQEGQTRHPESVLRHLGLPWQKLGPWRAPQPAEVSAASGAKEAGGLPRPVTAASQSQCGASADSAQVQRGHRSDRQRPHELPGLPRHGADRSPPTRARSAGASLQGLITAHRGLLAQAG